MSFETITYVLIAIGIFECLIIVAAIILSQLTRRSANLFLAFFLVTLGLICVEIIVLHEEAYIRENPDWIMFIYGFSEPLSYLSLPAIYLYVKSLTQGQNQIQLSDFKHGVWFIVAMILYIPLLTLSSEQLINLNFMFFGQASFDAELQHYLTLMKVIWIYSAALTTCYLIASFNLLSNYRIGLDDLFSNSEGATLSWLKWMLYSIATLLVIMVVTLAVPSLIFKATPSFETLLAVCISLLLFFHLVGFKGLLQPKLFNVRTGYALDKMTHAKKHRYQNSSLTPEKTAHYKQKLTDYMKAHQPYMNSELTLVHLADMMGIEHYHHLSQVINTELSSSFKDYINEYRIEEAKRQLIEYPHKTSLTIALHVGFKNTSSFHTAFKKVTGLTPKEYQAHMRTLPFSRETHSF